MLFSSVKDSGHKVHSCGFHIFDMLNVLVYMQFHEEYYSMDVISDTLKVNEKRSRHCMTYVCEM